MASRKSKAFTLIELLIVIVIIGILAGVVLAILNPARQQQRAREAVFLANVSKYCTALMACASTTTNATKCTTLAQIGVIDQAGTPIPNSQYVLNTAANTYTAIGAVASTDTIFMNARFDSAADATTCKSSCSYNFSTATPTGATPGVNCITN